MYTCTASPWTMAQTPDGEGSDAGMLAADEATSPSAPWPPSVQPSKTIKVDYCHS